MQSHALAIAATYPRHRATLGATQVCRRDPTGREPKYMPNPGLSHIYVWSSTQAPPRPYNSRVDIEGDHRPVHLPSMRTPHRTAPAQTHTPASGLPLTRHTSPPPATHTRTCCGACVHTQDYACVCIYLTFCCAQSKGAAIDIRIDCIACLPPCGKLLPALSACLSHRPASHICASR